LGYYSEALDAYDRAEAAMGEEGGDLDERIVAGRVYTLMQWGQFVQAEAEGESDDRQAQERYQQALVLFDQILQIDPDYDAAQQAKSEIGNAMNRLQIQPILLNP
jgi:tetratricopeptide (TPR) repeat protein